jgi:sirohydrochlorin ferrochelatase
VSQRALLIVDHGSRRREAHDHLEKLAHEVRALLPSCIVRVAHMEVASPSIEEGIDACVADGASEIVVHPFFLVPGRHLTEDIPGLVARAADRHAGVKVRITEPIGSAPGLARLIARHALD